MIGFYKKNFFTIISQTFCLVRIVACNLLHICLPPALISSFAKPEVAAHFTKLFEKIDVKYYEYCQKIKSRFCVHNNNFGILFLLFSSVPMKQTLGRANKQCKSNKKRRSTNKLCTFVMCFKLYKIKQKKILNIKMCSSFRFFRFKFACHTTLRLQLFFASVRCKCLSLC